MWTIIQRSGAFADRLAVISANREATWGSLLALSHAAVNDLEYLRCCRVGIVCDASPECFAALAACDLLKANAFLLDAGKTSAEISELASQFQLQSVVRIAGEFAWAVEEIDPSPVSASAEHCVTILTSGTTGKPKAARHTWETLSRPVAALQDLDESLFQTGNIEHQRWLLTFRPQLYAGLQVVLHAFANAGALVVPNESSDQNALVSFMANNDVGYVSATPSFWRGLLLHVGRENLARLAIRQITLGGELADQSLLDALAATFPGVRITHIYATTELGKCFSVTDGTSGFPVSYLGKTLPGGVELKVDQGQLFVRSGNRMTEYDPLGSRLELSSDDASRHSNAGWTYTGDLVEVSGDRVQFVGRDTDIINVGGYKVNPTKVEEILRQVPAVADVRVFGQSSSVTGQIVACDIAVATGFAPEAALRAVREAAMGKLDRYHLPRIINVVDKIELTPAGKVRRGD